MFFMIDRNAPPVGILEFMPRAFLFLAAALVAAGVPPGAAESKAAVRARGRAEMRRTCHRCHPLAVIRAQHLGRDEWEDEVRKMEHLGAEIGNRDALLEYLASAYGKPRDSTSTR